MTHIVKTQDHQTLHPLQLLTFNYFQPNCVCLGVPYGTAYWQVGDSKEQNGSFNIAMTDAKRKLLDLKRQSCMNETIDKGDLMLFINTAWNKSFARVNKNRRAIVDRRWGPYNRNILTFSHIRATMTETDRIYDLNYQVVYHHLH